MAAQNNRASARADYYAEHPWPTGKTRENLPRVHWDFANAEDPTRIAQLQDITKTEKQRRDEAQGRNSQMIVLDKPLLTLTPPSQFRRAADRAAFTARWMNEQKEAAFASNDEFMKTLTEKERQQPEPERDYPVIRHER